MKNSKVKTVVNRLFLLLALLAAAGNAAAVSEYNKAIASVGVGVNLNPLLTGNLKPAEKLTTDCLYGVLYFDVGSAVGKAMYSTLLTARAGGKKLARIDYFQNGSWQVCTLTYVELAD